MSVDSIFLSPHLDDVALSCGAWIHSRTSTGHRVMVVTAFAGTPAEPPESKVVETLHRAWGFEDAAEAVARRREEDREACAILGAEAVHWDLPEAIYRVGRDGAAVYPGLSDLFRHVRSRDRPTVAAVADRISGLPEHRELFVPLAVGGHVDHRIVRLAAEQRFGARLCYYEEYPYAGRRRAVRAATAGERWRSRVVESGDADLEAKLRAVRAYRSQVRPLFGGKLRLRWKLRRKHRKVGGERVWWPEV